MHVLRLTVTDLLTLMFGVLVAFGVALLIGLAFPEARIPIFIGLSIWWMWLGWRYAKQEADEAASLGLALKRA
jgi:hypothetical protein